MTVRVISTWCAEKFCSRHVAVLLAIDDGYYLSCRRWDPDRGRYVEFWGFFRERGEFHEQDEADRWAVEYMRRPVQDSFPVGMVQCERDVLDVARSRPPAKAAAEERVSA